MNNIIKPCPFCGHDAWLMNTIEAGATDDPPNCHVGCSHCLAQGPLQEMTETATRTEMKRAERAALAAWNKRASAPQSS